MRPLLKLGAGLVAVPAVALAGVAAYFAAVASTREPLEVTIGTRHATFDRQSCIECHAPIAAEWRESFHSQTVTGPYWQRLRDKRYDRVFDVLRMPCMSCHAPANVLDLPEGAYPVQRSDATHLAVDCASCHLSERGVAGPGRADGAPHEVIRDARFRDPAVTSKELCARCHEEQGDCAKVVTEWSQSGFAARGVTCVHCHMPEVEAPSVIGGAIRRRRSHRFVGDKDDDLLRSALNAAIVLDGRKATVRLTNDRVGHSLPASGMNWLLVTVRVRDAAGGVVSEVARGFGSREMLPGYLDFWPFKVHTRIPAGESRDIEVSLPPAPGTVSATFHYRDFASIDDDDRLLTTLTRDFR